MAYLRINIQVRLLKPIPGAVQTKLTAAQMAIDAMVAYSQKINPNLLNEEAPHATYDNQAGWINIDIDLAVPSDPTGTWILQNIDPDGVKTGGIQVASVIVPKLVNLRNKVRDFKQYLTNNDSGTLMTQIFICHHDDPDHLQPDEPRMEI